jgi:hypothetical protein
MYALLGGKSPTHVKNLGNNWSEIHQNESEKIRGIIVQGAHSFTSFTDHTRYECSPEQKESIGRNKGYKTGVWPKDKIMD